MKLAPFAYRHLKEPPPLQKKPWAVGTGLCKGVEEQAEWPRFLKTVVFQWRRL